MERNTARSSARQIYARPMHLPHLLVLGSFNDYIYTENDLWKAEESAEMVTSMDILATKHTQKDVWDEFTYGSGIDGLNVIAVYRDWWEDVQKYVKGDVK